MQAYQQSFAPESLSSFAFSGDIRRSAQGFSSQGPAFGGPDKSMTFQGHGFGAGFSSEQQHAGSFGSGGGFGSEGDGFSRQGHGFGGQQTSFASPGLGYLRPATSPGFSSLQPATSPGFGVLQPETSPGWHPATEPLSAFDDRALDLQAPEASGRPNYPGKGS